MVDTKFHFFKLGDKDNPAKVVDISLFNILFLLFSRLKLKTRSGETVNLVGLLDSK